MTVDSHFIALLASDNPTKSVTIFQSSTAEVTREFTVSLQVRLLAPWSPINYALRTDRPMLQVGRNVIEIRGVSSNIDVESPRVHGLGRDARVFDVSCNKSSPHEPLWRDRKKAEEIKDLRAKRTHVDTERQMREREAALLDSAAAATVKDKGVDVELMVRLLERKRDATKAVIELKEQLNELDRAIRVLEAGHVGKCETTIVATVIAGREGEVTFQLTYRKQAIYDYFNVRRSLGLWLSVVSGVSWRPSYDLHATTEDGHTSPDVSLVYCANITQTTGEDWNNVSLTLSNASSQTLESLAVPTLSALTLAPIGTGAKSRRRHAEPIVVVPSFSRTPVEVPHLTSSASPRPVAWDPPTSFAVECEDRPAANLSPPQVRVDAVALDRSPLALAYRVEGDVTLASDGLAHRIAIAMLEFKADLKYVCAPRVNTAVFIEASVKNTSEYELLAGPVSVFMDGGFVTKTSLGVSSPAIVFLYGTHWLTSTSYS